MKHKIVLLGDSSVGKTAIINQYIYSSSSPDYKKASAFLKRSIEDFINSETDEVFIVHNGFKSVISQEVKVKKILPFVAHKEIEDKEHSIISADPEEGEQQILQELSTQYLDYNIYYNIVLFNSLFSFKIISGDGYEE